MKGITKLTRILLALACATAMIGTAVIVRRADLSASASSILVYAWIVPALLLTTGGCSARSEIACLRRRLSERLGSSPRG